MRQIFSLLGLGILSCTLQAQVSNYEKPPAEMSALLEADPTPVVSLSPIGSAGPRTMAILQPAGLPSIAELSQSEYRLAGLRFNPNTRTLSRRQVKYLSLKLKAIPDGKELPVTGLPAGAKLIEADWSPDGKKIVVASIGNAGLSLWIVDARTAKATQVPAIKLNGILSKPCAWVSDSEHLVCLTVPSTLGPAPKAETVVQGPTIQENLGRVTPARTNEDMLANPHDEQIFEYYATSQPVLIGLSGTTHVLAKPAIYEQADPSPDGKYVLLMARHRPFSYLIPLRYFPVRTSVVDVRAGTEKVLDDKPISDAIVISFDATEPGNRGYKWRSDAPATVAWVFAEDGGDVRKSVAIRDSLYTLDAPFLGEPKKIAGFPLRVIDKAYDKSTLRVTWGPSGTVLVEQQWRKDRKQIFTLVSLNTGKTRDIYTSSMEDHYGDPGDPMTQVNTNGATVLDLTSDGKSAYFAGTGASPEGDHPFISTINLDSGERKELWRSAPKEYEMPYARIADSNFLVRRESPTTPPNYFTMVLGSEDWKQLTTFGNPYGTIALPKRQTLHYKRKDGLELSADLYLPPDYKPSDGPLPTLIHAYPVEYKSRDAAGQVIGSPYVFPRYIFSSIPILFATQGYAVLHNAAIPIVGQGNEEPNDTYVEQLVAGAQAAIDAGKQLGVVDPNRVAVMGHSYGAFMTANLLAHSNLFKAGIAMSGAYNRSLTPFGFQREERVYWQDPKLYFDMSPFSYADKIKTPILLFHGMADDNQGTFPIQSERFYEALKGNGATVRFVYLPLEAHVYAGRESLETLMAETKTWLDSYVKNAPPNKK